MTVSPTVRLAVEQQVVLQRVAGLPERPSPSAVRLVPHRHCDAGGGPGRQRRRVPLTKTEDYISVSVPMSLRFVVNDIGRMDTEIR